MAVFTDATFKKHDDWMTPKSAWESIRHYIPADKIIWEAFFGDSTSGTHLTELGFNVVHEDVDFFENDLGEIIVSNPPFTKIKDVLPRLKELGKPFILIMPSSKINTQYFREFVKDNPDKLQLIVPKNRIKFVKMIDGVVMKDAKSSPNFDCFYYCWKIGLPEDICFLW